MKKYLVILTVLFNINSFAQTIDLSRCDQYVEREVFRSQTSSKLIIITKGVKCLPSNNQCQQQQRQNRHAYDQDIEMDQIKYIQSGEIKKFNNTFYKCL